MTTYRVRTFRCTPSELIAFAQGSQRYAKPPIYYISSEYRETIQSVPLGVEGQEQRINALAAACYNFVVGFDLPYQLGYTNYWRDRVGTWHSELEPGQVQPVSWESWERGHHPNVVAMDKLWAHVRTLGWGGINGSGIDWFRWRPGLEVMEEGNILEPRDAAGDCYKCKLGIHADEYKQKQLEMLGQQLGDAREGLQQNLARAKFEEERIGSLESLMEDVALADPESMYLAHLKELNGGHER